MNAAGMRAGAVTVGESPGSCRQDTQPSSGGGAPMAAASGSVTTDNAYSHDTGRSRRRGAAPAGALSGDSVRGRLVRGGALSRGVWLAGTAGTGVPRGG